ncbi:4a-hydroxytetrahydrobiopterin dehydratase [Nakamurella sp. UYEF19]|uniref:VOC family protein n=1 Tax=Nakamurella sp. UYEF19 TaxID=1756392 RepID=UPI003395AD2A
MNETEAGRRLSRTAASEQVVDIGWRYLLGTLSTSVAVGSMAESVQVAKAAVSACSEHAEAHLRVDLRPDRVELSLQTRTMGAVTGRDAALARAVTAALTGLGFRTGGSTTGELPRPVQMLELAIDAMDIVAIRPFWEAVLAYVDDPGDPGPDGGIVDPTGQLPTIWFQQMDAERLQRNRIHLDITVAHDEAADRVAAAVAAGGRLIDDSYARSFWVLADAEGNEVCVCTWTDRDERDAARTEP